MMLDLIDEFIQMAAVVFVPDLALRDDCRIPLVGSVFIVGVAPLVCANILEVDSDGVVRIHKSVLLEDAEVQVLLISEQATKKSRLAIVLIFGLHVEVGGGNDLKVRVEELNMVR